MNELLEYKGKFMGIYREFEIYFKIAAKFIFALLTLNSISSGLGYFEVLNLMSIRLFIAVVCAFIPVPMVVFVLTAVILLHLFKLSVVFAALALVVFLIMYLLYLKFAPSHGIYMLAVVALAPFHLEVAVPLISGMFFSPVTIIPISIGIFTVKFLGCISEAAGTLGTSTEIDKIVASMQSVVDSLMGDKEMILYIITFAAVVVLVYIVKKLPFDYSWYAAIGAGALLNIVMLGAGAAMLDVNVSLTGVVLGTLAAALAVALLQFLECTVDYSRKEFLEFEDDDYYYYVKAIPKMGTAPYNGKDNAAGDDDVLMTESQDDMVSERGGKFFKSGKPKWGGKLLKDESFENGAAGSKKESRTKEAAGSEDTWLADISEAVSKKPDRTDNAVQDDFDDFSFSDFDDDESKF